MAARDPPSYKEVVGVDCTGPRQSSTDQEEPHSSATNSSTEPERVCFFITCDVNRMTLAAIGGENAKPGNRVILEKKRKSSALKQLWYIDERTQTICNRANGLCLDVLRFGLLSKPIIVVEKIDPRKTETQRWRLAGQRIENSKNPRRGLSVAKDCRKPGESVYFDKFTEEMPSHCWKFEFSPPKPKPRYYFIRNQRESKVLDIKKDNRYPGASVIVSIKKSGTPSSQLWYIDENEIIRSKLNDYALDCANGKDGKVQMHPYDKNEWSGHWLRDESNLTIYNKVRKTLVLEAEDAKMLFSQDVLARDLNGLGSQKWDFDRIV